MCVAKLNLKYGIAYFIIQEAADFRNDCQIELKPKTYYASKPLTQLCKTR